MSDIVEETEVCEKPCRPDYGCDQCADYWNRMRHEGFWKDGSGWTTKGMKEMLKP